MVGLSEAFGPEFEQRYRLAIKTRRKRLVLEGKTKTDLIQAIKAKLTPEKPQLMYTVQNSVYHIILAETMPELRPRQLEWGTSVNMRYQGNIVSAIVQEDILARLNPETPYVLVGYLKITPRKDGQGVWYNMNVDAILTMDDIANE